MCDIHDTLFVRNQIYLFFSVDWVLSGVKLPKKCIVNASKDAIPLIQIFFLLTCFSTLVGKRILVLTFFSLTTKASSDNLLVFISKVLLEVHVFRVILESAFQSLRSIILSFQLLKIQQ